MKINRAKTIIITSAFVTLVACSSGERKVNKAEAEHTREQTKTMQEYKSCIKKAKQDQDKLDNCERLIKANH